jgi:hypothetical protein
MKKQISTNFAREKAELSFYYLYRKMITKFLSCEEAIREYTVTKM